VPENTVAPAPAHAEVRPLSELGAMVIANARERFAKELAAIVDAVGRNDHVPPNQGWNLNIETSEWYRFTPPPASAPADVDANGVSAAAATDAQPSLKVMP
jgi:hypothetical protein